MKKAINIVFIVAIALALTLALNRCAESTSKKPVRDLKNWFEYYESLKELAIKPDESVNQDEFKKEYLKNKLWWDEAFEFINSNDLKTMVPGFYVIDTGNVTATISLGVPSDLENVKWEAHEKFNDLQYIIEGYALMGTSPLASSEVIEPYDPKRDIAFYKTSGSYYLGKPETFFIFTPQDVHQPAIRVPVCDTIKKLVIKIRSHN